MMRTLFPFLLACVCGLVAVGAGAQEPLVPNFDFSEGLKGWTAWSSNAQHPWSLDEAVGHAGKPSLRIEARNPSGNVMVMTETDRLKPGERYVIDAWWRTEGVSADASADLRIIFRDAAGAWLTGDDIYPYATQTEGEWTLKRYRIIPPERTVSATVGFWVREATGTFWISDLSIRAIPKGERTYPSMYDYDPDEVTLGPVPLEAFNKLKETDSPFLPRAKRWNQLLFKIAFWQEDFSRTRRAILYLGRSQDSLGTHGKALNAALADLDRLQQLYGRLYVAQAAAELPTKLDPELERLEKAVAAGHAGLQRFLAGLAPGDAKWAIVPRAPTDQPWWDAEKKRPRYILWNRWSNPAFHDMEELLEMGDCQTLTSGYPITFEKGVAGWQNYLDQWEKLREVGIRRSSLITHYSLHDKGYLAPEFVKAQGDDPDLRIWDAEGKPMGPKSGVTLFNWLNPKAGAHMEDVLTQMARFFKDRKEYQFYVDSWECAGPYASGVRIGYNPSHQAAFRDYLRARYGSIERLNQAWNTRYGSFEEIKPAPEKPVAVGDAAAPLAIESQRWAQEAYVDYLKRIRDTIAAVDPTKPVFGEHSGLLDRVLSPRIWESVDILGYHNRGRTTMPVQVWMASLQRVMKKPMGLFENFWGCQEDHPQRMHEERVMRAQMRRYLYRHAVWGHCTQTWWYAYTTAPYLKSYNGNWFTPIYDLTTFRYSAPGFPIEKRKVDRVQSLLLGSEIVPSRVLLVQPYAEMLAQGPRSEVLNEWLAWHRLLFPRNQLYEVLPDTWFAEGKVKLSGFDVVILPVACHLERAFTQQLVEFLRAGGVVIASGAPGLYDQLGRPDGSLLAAAGLSARRESKPGEAWRFSYGAPVNERGWVEAKVGKGSLLLLPSSLAGLKTRDALAERVRAHAVPAAEAPGTTLELLLRALPDGRYLLCALNTSPDAPTTGDVVVRGSFTRVADIDMPRAFPVTAKRAEERTRFRITLDPGGTAYYLLAR
ncbi:MAG TPA: beta-galactosidase [Armatimonadota bacterium]|nr:beta-galactosidase [Armatimonadota bacterium]HPO72051.1 beta-galactosidase [Armatimonadota bacterium]